MKRKTLLRKGTAFVESLAPQTEREHSIGYLGWRAGYRAAQREARDLHKREARALNDATRDAHEEAYARRQIIALAGRIKSEKPPK